MTIHLQRNQYSGVNAHANSLLQDSDYGWQSFHHDHITGNKPPQSGYSQYHDKRNATLWSGMPLIEIDYLHQQPSVNKRLPMYPDMDGSHPYSVIVNNPQPSLSAAYPQTLAFAVNEPIPAFDIPPDENRRVEAFDLGAVYDYTFAQARDLVTDTDCAAPPLQLQTYSAADQVRIERQMRLIAAMIAAGHDLDHEGPFLIGEGD